MRQKAAREQDDQQFIQFKGGLEKLAAKVTSIGDLADRMKLKASGSAMSGGRSDHDHCDEITARASEMLEMAMENLLPLVVTTALMTLLSEYIGVKPDKEALDFKLPRP